MSPPKLQGRITILKGIRHNRKFNFFVVYERYNTPNTSDQADFFLTREEAEQKFNSLK